MIQINQQLDVDALIEEIEFAKQIGMSSSFGSCKLFIKAIETETLYNILRNRFPQIKQYLDGNTTEEMCQSRV